jgi:hypothetical protein
MRILKKEAQGLLEDEPEPPAAVPAAPSARCGSPASRARTPVMTKLPVPSPAPASSENAYRRQHTFGH